MYDKRFYEQKDRVFFDVQCTMAVPIGAIYGTSGDHASRSISHASCIAGNQLLPHNDRPSAPRLRVEDSPGPARSRLPRSPREPGRERGSERSWRGEKFTRVCKGGREEMGGGGERVLRKKATFDLSSLDYYARGNNEGAFDGPF